MSRSALMLAGGLLLLQSGCIHVKTEPVDVHMTVDVNVRVDQALDNFFGQLDRQSATLNQAPKPNP